MDQQLLRILCGIATVIIVTVIIVIRIYKVNQSKEEALNFLETLSNSIYKDLLKLIKDDPSIFKDPLEVAEKKVLETIYEATWRRIQSYIASAKDQGELDDAIFYVIDRDFVEKFLDTIIERFAVKDIIKNEWMAANSDEFVDRVEAEDKALQEKFSDEELYNEKAFNEDLEPSDPDKVYIPNEDGSISEIKRPPELEDPDLDSVRDESIEFVGEDGLTDEERNTGVHFNKAGRKVDSKGRFVKKNV